MHCDYTVRKVAKILFMRYAFNRLISPWVHEIILDWHGLDLNSVRYNHEAAAFGHLTNYFTSVYSLHYIELD